MKLHTEVTKYNPIYRDENGFFLKKDEWLDYSCIGHKDDDGILTREKYLETEQKYVDAVKLYCQYYNFSKFNFTSIESRSNKRDFKEEDLYMYDFYKKLKKHKEIELDVSDIEILTRLILRTLIWGKIIFVLDEYEIGFGYDYYMDFLIGDRDTFHELKKQIISMGLFLGRSVEDNII